MKEEILQTIREELAKEFRWSLYQHLDFIEGIDTEIGIQKNIVSFNLTSGRELHIDLAKKLFTIVEFKFDHYRDPCPGYVYENEVDVTETCLKLIGDLADIMVVFSDRHVD